MALIPAVPHSSEIFGLVKMLSTARFCEDLSTQSLFSLDCEMFRSCLFFYVLLAANVKKKKHINGRVIRSGVGCVATGPIVSARWRRAVSPLFGRSSALLKPPDSGDCTC